MDSIENMLNEPIGDSEEELARQDEETCDFKTKSSPQYKDLVQKIDKLQNRFDKIQRQVEEIEIVLKQTLDTKQQNKQKPIRGSVGKQETSKEDVENELCTYMYNSTDSVARKELRDGKADEKVKTTRRVTKTSQKPSWHY